MLTAPTVDSQQTESSGALLVITQVIIYLEHRLTSRLIGLGLLPRSSTRHCKVLERERADGHDPATPNDPRCRHTTDGKHPDGQKLTQHKGGIDPPQDYTPDDS